MIDPVVSTATKLAAVIRARDVSAVEALEAYLHQIERYNPVLNAVVTLDSVTAFHHREPGMPLHMDGEEISYWMVSAHTTLFNYTGHPAVVLPCGQDKDGMPIGVQVVGKRWDEAGLLAAAKAITEVSGGFRPPPGFDSQAEE